MGDTTVTLNSLVTLPLVSGSVAVTVMSVLPSRKVVISNSEPSAFTVAMLVLEDVAV